MSDDAPSPQPLSRKGRGASIVPRPPAGEGQAARSDARERGRRIAKLRTHAKTMRSAPTPAEHRLWQILRAHRFADYKFRRQVPIDHYIADFLCPAERLIIELDGGQHAANSHDTPTWQAPAGLLGYSPVNTTDIDQLMASAAAKDPLMAKNKPEEKMGSRNPPASPVNNQFLPYIF